MQSCFPILAHFQTFADRQLLSDAYGGSLQPNHINYSAAINVCARSGQWEQVTLVVPLLAVA